MKPAIILYKSIKNLQMFRWTEEYICIYTSRVYMFIQARGVLADIPELKDMTLMECIEKVNWNTPTFPLLLEFSNNFQL